MMKFMNHDYIGSFGNAKWAKNPKRDNNRSYISGHRVHRSSLVKLKFAEEKSDIEKRSLEILKYSLSYAYARKCETISQCDLVAIFVSK